MKFHLDTRTVEFYCEQDGKIIGKKTLRYNGRIYLGGVNLYGTDHAEYYCDYIQLNCDAGGHFANSGSRDNNEVIVTEENMSRNNVKKRPFDPNRRDNPTQSTSQRVPVPIE